MPPSTPSARPSRGIARLLNVLIAVAAIGFIVLLIRGQYRRAPANPIIVPSARISLDGVDFKQTNQTLLLAVARDCEYCSESARFYRRLVAGLEKRKDLRVVAVFPDPQSDGQYYLNSLGLNIRESLTAALPSLGIRNVPTLVLLDHEGVVQNVWIGKLPINTEVEVLKALAIPDTRPSTDWIVSEAEINRRLANKEALVLVDLRDRASYSHGHLGPALNIPYDELKARAANELSNTATIVLYSDDEAVADSSYTILDRLKFPKVFILKN